MEKNQQFVISPQFRKMTPEERLLYLSTYTNSIPKDFVHPNKNTSKLANQMTENAVGVMSVPLGIVENVLINNIYHHIPIATEEPSVCAGASFGAKILGNIESSSSRSLQDAHIAFNNISPEAEKKIKIAHKEIINSLMETMPNMYRRGGGLKALNFYTPRENWLVLLLRFDTCDAMGANTVNTAVEQLVPLVEKISGAKVLSAILSNFSDLRLAQARCEVSLEKLSSDKNKAILLTKKIEAMCLWAKSDIRRATTHNKGILNGLSSLALATGNDTRALEAASHSLACVGGTYSPLSNFYYNEKKNTLVGEVEIPALFATVGGATAHPTAQWAQSILTINHKKPINAYILNSVAAALGLVQNFAALRALVTEGIQKGHMKLHGKRHKQL